MGPLKASADSWTPSPKLKEWHSVQELLALAFHRNKNQHSHARWWSSLGILRRAVGRLVVELEDLEEVESQRKKKGFGMRGAREVELAEVVDRRKDWMRRQVVEKCWV
jgi:hypothetical protein